MNEKLLLSVFVAVEGAHAFSAFMPSYFTVRKFAEDNEDIEKLRSGYIPASIFNLALGGTVTVITKSALPFTLSVIVCIFMIVLYEQAINKNDEPKPIVS